jgi:hypothetical protein
MGVASYDVVDIYDYGKRNITFLSRFVQKAVQSLFRHGFQSFQIIGMKQWKDLAMGELPNKGLNTPHDRTRKYAKNYVNGYRISI